MKERVSGTHLIVSLRHFEGPRILRTLATRFLARSPAEFRGQLCELAATLEAEWAVQQSRASLAHSVALTPESISECSDESVRHR